LLEKWGYSKPTVAAYKLEEEYRGYQTEQDRKLESGEISVDDWREVTDGFIDELAAKKDVIYGDLPDEQRNLADQFFAERDANKERNAGVVNWEQMEAWEAEHPDVMAAMEALPVTGLTDTVKEYREVASTVREAGYYELYDEAWRGMQAAYPQLQGWATWDTFRDESIRYRVEELVAQGYDARASRTYAEEEFDSGGWNQAMSAYKNSDIENAWLVENYQILYDGWRWGLITLTDDQERWMYDLIQQGYITP
jgi:hypothetical protein